MRRSCACAFILRTERGGHSQIPSINYCICHSILVFPLSCHFLFYYIITRGFTFLSCFRKAGFHSVMFVYAIFESITIFFSI